MPLVLEQVKDTLFHLKVEIVHMGTEKSVYVAVKIKTDIKWYKIKTQRGSAFLKAYMVNLLSGKEH